jgi:hypothetical protein
MASYFCLESEHWRIVGLDTGYNSVGLPFLGSIPGIKDLSWVGANCRLEDSLITWLRETLRPASNRKATLLLSHHQYYSVYEEAHPKPAEQLKEFFGGQSVVWIWGHEHRLSVYDLYSPDGNITCYGRCLGHGGMPVEVETEGKKAPLAFLDPRGLKQTTQYPIGDGSYAGWNGHVNVEMTGPTMTLTYVDLKGEVLFVETFTAQPDGNVSQRTMSSPVLRPPA